MARLLLIHPIGVHVIVESDPIDGGYFATVPALPGCGSQGESIQEALESVSDAMETVLEILKEDDPPRFQAVVGQTAWPSNEPGEMDSTSPALQWEPDYLFTA